MARSATANLETSFAAAPERVEDRNEGAEVVRMADHLVQKIEQRLSQTEQQQVLSPEQIVAWRTQLALASQNSNTAENIAALEKLRNNLEEQIVLAPQQKKLTATIQAKLTKGALFSPAEMAGWQSGLQNIQDEQLRGNITAAEAVAQLENLLSLIPAFVEDRKGARSLQTSFLKVVQANTQTKFLTFDIADFDGVKDLQALNYTDRIAYFQEVALKLEREFQTFSSTYDNYAASVGAEAKWKDAQTVTAKLRLLANWHKNMSKGTARMTEHKDMVTKLQGEKKLTAARDYLLCLRQEPDAETGRVWQPGTIDWFLGGVEKEIMQALQVQTDRVVFADRFEAQGNLEQALLSLHQADDIEPTAELQQRIRKLEQRQEGRKLLDGAKILAKQLEQREQAVEMGKRAITLDPLLQVEFDQWQQELTQDPKAQEKVQERTALDKLKELKRAEVLQTLGSKLRLVKLLQHRSQEAGVVTNEVESGSVEQRALKHSYTADQQAHTKKEVDARKVDLADADQSALHDGKGLVQVRLEDESRRTKSDALAKVTREVREGRRRADTFDLMKMEGGEHVSLVRAEQLLRQQIQTWYTQTITQLNLQHGTQLTAVNDNSLADKLVQAQTEAA